MNELKDAQTYCQSKGQSATAPKAMKNKYHRMRHFLIYVIQFRVRKNIKTRKCKEE